MMQYIIKKYFKDLKLLTEYFRDKNISILSKLKIIILLMFSIGYFLSPIDIIPDLILGIGWIEDIFVLISILVYINGILKKYSEMNNKKNKKENIIDI